MDNQTVNPQYVSGMTDDSSCDIRPLPFKIAETINAMEDCN